MDDTSCPFRRVNVTIVCLLDGTNTDILSFLVFPRIDLFGNGTFGDDDPWLREGERLPHLSQFCQFVRMAARPC